MKRGEFIRKGAFVLLSSYVPFKAFGFFDRKGDSIFADKLEVIGRGLELKDFYVWGSSPIEGADGKIHLFYSRWPKSKKMSGWTHASEIARAVADSPDGPFRHVETVIAPTGRDEWDSVSCHNPTIHFVDGKYALFYMGNSNGKLETQRIGLAFADSIEGPWERPKKPILLPGEAGEWDDYCTTNPAFIKHPTNGQYWLYYKSFEEEGYVEPKFSIRGNRKIGLAIADDLMGPYLKYDGNPIVDFSSRGNNEQCEDPFVWHEDGRFRMLVRDIGIFGNDKGLYLGSNDGVVWDEPEIGYYSLKKYFDLPEAPAHLTKYGRAERPQVLIQGGKATYLYTAAQGGKYNTSSALIFKINN